MTRISLFETFAFVVAIVNAAVENEENLPSRCHVCKYMTRELSEELGRSDKSNDVLYMGQLFQKEPKKIQYRQSELRLTEALENACSNVLEYKVHKDKPLSLRYEKVESTTFKTLKGLKQRGVKVDLGFPDQMWDTPDVEVTRLKSRCEQMVELYEDEISNWYWELPEKNLTQWLCVERVLKSSENDCLNEIQNDKTTDDKQTKTAKGKRTEGKQGNDINKNPNKEEQRNYISHEGQDKEKIQRLIQEQAEEQSRSDRFSSDEFPRSMTESKRKQLRERLYAINDPHRLRREIRKIRTKELTKEEYGQRQAHEQFETVEDFQNEINTSIFELEQKAYVMESTAFREMLQRYSEDAKQIRDKKELQKRLGDLNAFSDIITDQLLHDEL